MRRVISICVFISCLYPCFGQITISGNVKNESGDPLPFTNISAFTLDSVLISGFVSEENGSFEIKLDENKYRVVFSYIGYEDSQKIISESANLEKIILRESSTQLENVTVTASRPAIQKLQDRLIVNVEGSILNTGNNTLEVLQRSPGIIVDQDGNISMGGRSGVRVYIDGKDTRLGGNQLASILEGMPASSIEKIEIITNPSSKYEAQGNAGIIDIITKKGKLLGTNGSITLSPGLGRYIRWDNNINLNYRNDKLNLYGQYSFAKRNQYMEIIIDRTFLDNDVVRSQIDMSTLFRLPIETHSPRLGMDYFISDKTTLGVLFTGFSNLTGQDANNVIDTYNGNAEFLLNQQTKMDTETTWQQYTSNINLKHQFSTGSELDIDLDYARYDNRSADLFASTYFDNNQTLLLENALIGDVDGELELLGFTIDYTKAFTNGNILEMGWKNTIVNTDNDLQYVDEENGIQSINTNLSNRFLYDENIYAAYTNYRFNKGNINGNLGLRAEYTDIAGEQLTTDDGFENNYLNLFPSMSLNYSSNENLGIGISISRRLDRPGYNDLNPFRFFVNNYTYRVGNPFLTPQFTWSFESNMTVKQRYYFAFSYGLITDNLTRAIIQDGEREEVIVTPLNIDNLNSFGFTASFPVNFSSRWTSQWNINASVNEFKGVIRGNSFDRTNPVLVVNTNHSLNIGQGYRIQIGAFYLPAHYGTVSKINTISNVTFGIQKSVLNNRGSLRLNVNDIFYQGYPTGRTIFGDLDDIFISKRDSRYATFSFNLRFGKQTVKGQRRRQSGIENELNRARQSNS